MNYKEAKEKYTQVPATEISGKLVTSSHFRYHELIIVFTDGTFIHVEAEMMEFEHEVPMLEDSYKEETKNG